MGLPASIVLTSSVYSYAMSVQRKIVLVKSTIHHCTRNNKLFLSESATSRIIKGF